MHPFPSALLLGAASGAIIGPGGPYTTTGQVGENLAYVLNASYTANANEMSLRWVIMPIVNCDVSTLDFDLSTVSTNGTKIRPLIYADNGSGIPGALVIQGSESTINIADTGTTKTLPLGSTVTLTAGTRYWIGWIADHSFFMHGDATSGYTRFVSRTYTSGAASTAPTMSTSTTRVGVRLNVTISDGIAGNWGYDNTTTGSYDASAGDVSVLQVAMPAAGTSTPLSVGIRMRNVTVGDKFKGVVYADSGGLPGALLATGSEVTVAFADQELESTFTSPPSLQPSTNYWIGCHGNGGSDLKTLGSSATNVEFVNSSYASGPPNPFGTPTSSTNKVGLYLKYS